MSSAARGDQTKIKIMQATIELSKSTHYAQVTVLEIIELAEVSVGTLHYHYESINKLRNELMTHCIDNSVLEIVAQGISDKNPLCQNLSIGTKLKALKSLVA